MHARRSQRAAAIAVRQHIVAQCHGIVVVIGGIDRQCQVNHTVAAVHRSKLDAMHTRSRQHAVAIAVGQHVVAQRHGIVV